MIIKPIYSFMDDIDQATEDALAITLAGQPSGIRIHFNTTTSQVRIWNGVAFENPPINALYQVALVSGTNIKTVNGNTLLGAGNIVLSGTGDLLSANNLSDLVDVPTARTNLGLNTNANQSDSTNKRFLTDAQQTVVSNTSGVNTGNETASTIGATINGSASAAPNDTDLITTVESSVVKKITWTDAKAFLKTFFDTLYQSTLSSGTNIKTVNGSSLLGSGNLVVSGGYHSVTTLAADQATGANTTPVSLTGVSFSYEANSKYRIWFTGRVQPAAATTGCGFQFDLSSAVTAIDLQFYHQLASTGTLSGGHSIADDASVGVSSGMPATGTYPVIGEGLLVTGANAGTAQLRFRSETTAVTTCKGGLTMVIEKIA